jgi:DNA anti-recombination protein RmuC
VVAGDGGAVLSKDEESIMRLYDEIGTALQQHAADCATMAASVRKVITANDGVIKRVMTDAQKRNAQEAKAADERILAAGGERMERFRSLLGEALKSCGTELQPELQKLTALRGD